MQIQFYDEGGEPLLKVEVDAEDHWEACEKGHDILRRGLVNGADDFQVLEDS